jgi:hypothetical protein
MDIPGVGRYVSFFDIGTEEDRLGAEEFRAITLLSK